ncbi:hypothetical protein PCL1391_2821 [Pseudomonas chlororaphis subsp. piscium]|nr:hypothetical protein C4K33_3053 [Pseudomonas chlororaphis subsp. piscium]AZC69783.1 hypothetical protein C4K32_3121 [Pseudomonas chlororaphis subsp. piscium]AZC89449.1 hypothetical protein C4K29_3148 [Pseudomonas chlororaphis subsp. piscium]KZO49866.1 hypothetical protein PCL1391_2821 [Pseudomonas chlororaphis subsp. piscium]
MTQASAGQALPLAQPLDTSSYFLVSSSGLPANSEVLATSPVHGVPAPLPAFLEQGCAS